MNVKSFIDRPILSAVISIAILLIGFICLSQLSLEQYPDIAPPTVRVSTSYTGASAETVQKSVIVPLEEAINGVEDMIYMTSSAQNSGSASISVYFKQGTDPDMAMVNVQNRVSEATSQLPSEVTKSGVTVRKRQTSTLMMVSLYSPDDSYPSNFLTNYMKINIEPQLSRIPGVGEVNVFGANYSMRIWLDPKKMAAYSLIPSDISTVLSQQNLESPTGKLGSESENVFQYTLKYRGRYEEETDYENLVIKSLPDGRILRLGDVAEIELGALNYTFISNVNHHPSCNCAIVQTSGSNANEVIKQIEKVLDEAGQNLPRGMEFAIITSVKDFLDASIKNVVETLIIAIFLVILMVWFFLHDIRATLIPAISIIVSLVGTFACIYAFGFSLNLLTLFALVLVIGTVVDDSIVVVEAVQARYDDGYKSPYRAAVDAMGGLSSAIITNTLVFMAVFIPVCFMGGTTGIFYTQFGITMAAAVAISCLNALTLCPALCALIMRPRKDPDSGEKLGFNDRFHYAFNRSFGHMQAKYNRGIFWLFKHKWMSWALLLVFVVGLGYLLLNTKTGLVPQEDLGTMSVNVQAAPGTNLEETKKIADEVEESIKDMPQMVLYSNTVGSNARHESTSTAASFNIKLKNWDERRKKEDEINSVIEDVYSRTAHISAADIRVTTRAMISGYGSGSGFELYVQDKKGGTIEDLLTYTRQFIAALNERPEISRAYTTFDTKYPQYIVDVDAALCIRNGLSPSDVLSALSGYLGGTYASNFNRFTKLYRVMVQASPQFRTDIASLSNIFVRNDSGEMTPVSQYIRLTKVYGSESLSRFNLFPAISVFGENGNGYSSGQAIQAVKETAEAYLPEGYGFEFGGMSREEASSGNTTVMVFAICLIFIYLILCALYESMVIPLAVILSVPFGLAGSFIFAKLWGLENNIYLQIGLIMLIGLLAKTAVLITEYASRARASGMSIAAAAMSAAKARLRPILMTSMTMIIGMLPLVFSRGAGANGNISVGVGAAGGMLVGTIALLFITPVFFLIFEYVEEKYLPHPHAGKTAGAVAVLVGMILMLPSCGVYKEYERPDLDVAEPDTSLAVLSWEQLFTDPQLVSLIDTALVYNTDLNQAYLKIQEAQASLRASKLAYWPSVSVDASAAPPGSGTNFDYDGDSDWSTSVSAAASWEIDAFGKKLNAKRSALASLEAQEAYAQAVRTELIASVADYYYTLLMLDKELEISDTTLATWDVTLEVLQALKLAGKSNEVDILQASASKKNLQASMVTLRQSIASTENALCTLIGISPRSILRGKLENQDFDSSLYDGIPLGYIASRPDVRQAEAGLAVAFYATNTARAAFYPSLTLSGSLGWTNGGEAITDPGSWIWKIVGGLSAPIFSQGSHRASLEIAKAQQEEARLEFRQVLLEAGNEVNDALRDLQATIDKIVYSTGRRDNLSEATEKIVLLMRYSDTTYLEVLVAQQSLLDAELGLIEDQAELISAYIDLYRALGGN